MTLYTVFSWNNPGPVVTVRLGRSDAETPAATYHYPIPHLPEPGAWS